MSGTARGRAQRLLGAAASRALGTRRRVEESSLRRQVASGLVIGDGWSLSGRCPSFGSEPWLIRIGRDVRFADDVRFVTHDGGTKVVRHKYGTTHLNRYGPIEVGDNCFFGIGVIVLPNVRIGSNCVVGAGSVVTADVADDTVVAGVPARVVTDLASYYERCRAETLLQKGHTVEDLRDAAWARFRAERSET